MEKYYYNTKGKRKWDVPDKNEKKYIYINSMNYVYVFPLLKFK